MRSAGVWYYVFLYVQELATGGRYLRRCKRRESNTEWVSKVFPGDSVCFYIDLDLESSEVFLYLSRVFIEQVKKFYIKVTGLFSSKL